MTWAHTASIYGYIQSISNLRNVRTSLICMTSSDFNFFHLNRVHCKVYHFAVAVASQNEIGCTVLSNGQCDSIPMITSSAVGHYRPLTGTHIYC